MSELFGRLSGSGMLAGSLAQLTQGVVTESLEVFENGVYVSPTGKAYDTVTVDIPLPRGQIEITENGVFDVKDYELANVSVPPPILITKSITENGTYNASDDNADGYSSVNVSVGIIDMTVTDNQYKLLVEPYTEDHTLTISFLQTVANGCTIDWGDGTSETSGGHTYLENIYTWYNNNLYTHTYSDTKLRVITVTANDGIIYLYGSRYASGSCIITIPTQYPGNSNGVKLYNDYYKGMLRQVSVGNNIQLDADKGDFLGGVFRALPRIVSNRYFNIGIDTVSLQVLDTTIYGDLIIPNGVSTISNYACQNLSCRYVIFPESIRTINSSAFSYAQGVHVYDFTAIQLIDGQFPVTLMNANAFNGITNFQTILFATREIAEAAKAATNWSTLAARIHYVGE